MRVLYTLLAVVCVVCVVSVLGVDRGKFKTCSQSGFCSRHRDYAKQTNKQSPYQVVANTAAYSDKRWRVDVRNIDLDVLFVLEITNYAHDTLRVQVREKNDIKQRYEVQDVLLDTVQPIEPKQQQQQQTDNEILVFGSVRVTLSPLRLDFLGADGEPHTSVNEQGLFAFEHHRTQTHTDTNTQQQDESDDFDEDEEDEEERELREQQELALLGEQQQQQEQEQQDQQQDNNPYKRMGDDRCWSESFGGHTDKKPHGPESIGSDFTFFGAKAVYGIPEHATRLALPPTVKQAEILKDPYRLYNLDVFEYELDETMALYGAIPLLIAHSGKRTTGLFWLNAAETWVDVAEQTETGIHTHWFSESGVVDFFVLQGPTPVDVFKQYGALTGYTELPAKFGIAYHQCRWNYRDEDDVESVNQNYDKHDLPLDVVWLDIEHTNGKKYFTWDTTHFSHPERMQDRLAAKGRRMVTIVDPHIKKESGYHVYDGGSSRDFWVKNEDDGDYEGWCWPGSSRYLDFTRNDVRDWWASLFSYDSYQGSSSSLFTWNDMNEPSVFNGPEVTMQKHLKHHGNIEHREIHNLFGMYVHEATHQGLIERNPGGRERPFVLSRAYFAGSQRYGAIWTGDNAADWEHLAASVPMILTNAITGLPFTGADVGGFFGNPSEELLIRWYEAGAYQPFFRAHAHLDTRRREPYLYKQETIDQIKQVLRERYQLLAYWYTLFRANSNGGLPPVLPLWAVFAQDEETFQMDDQHLLGSLMIKPITSAGQSDTTIYLPGDQPWYNTRTNEQHLIASGRRRRVDAPLGSPPVFQQGGSIVPRQMRARRSSTQMLNDPFTLVVALDLNGEAKGELYHDDGTTFDYQQGKYLIRQFSFSKSTLSSTTNEPTNYTAPNKVERVVVLGLGRQATKAIVRVAGEQREVDVELGANNALTVRNPAVPLDSDWSIELQ